MVAPSPGDEVDISEIEPVDGKHTTALKRPRMLVIDDDPDCGPASFYTGKQIKAHDTGCLERPQATSVAMRGFGMQKYSKVARFI